MFGKIRKKTESKEIDEMAITKDMTIGKVVSEFPNAVRALMGFGMGCIGCPSAQSETLEEAAGVHGIDVDTLLKTLNASV